VVELDVSVVMKIVGIEKAAYKGYFNKACGMFWNRF